MYAQLPKSLLNEFIFVGSSIFIIKIIVWIYFCINFCKIILALLETSLISKILDITYRNNDPEHSNGFHNNLDTAPCPTLHTSVTVDWSQYLYSRNSHLRKIKHVWEKFRVPIIMIQIGDRLSLWIFSYSFNSKVPSPFSSHRWRHKRIEVYLHLYGYICYLL